MSAADYPKEKREWRWRGDLLSSSLPLEYRVARILVSQGFGVTPDFSYVRIIANQLTEFSADIFATRNLRTNRTLFGIPVRLLLECKYRRPSKVWFFVPNPEDFTEAHYFPSSILRCGEVFSDVAIDHDALFDFAADVRTCYKGVEIDLEAGNGNRVSDDELKHGLEQLQYGLAAMLSTSVRRSFLEIAYNGVSEPFFFAPILVTTAPIYVAHPDLRDDEISSASGIEAFADRVPWISLKFNIGHDLPAHVSRELNALSENIVKRSLDVLAEVRSNKEETLEWWQLLTSGGPDDLSGWFSQVLVCTVDALPELLSRILLAATNAVPKHERPLVSE